MKRGKEEKVGMEIAADKKRAGDAKGDRLMRFLRNAPDSPPEPEDEIG